MSGEHTAEKPQQHAERVPGKVKKYVNVPPSWSRPSLLGASTTKKTPSVERQLLRPWLIKQINKGDIPNLNWVDRERMIFRIPWKHRSLVGWREKDDACLFMRWARHTGRYVEGRDDPDPKRWKANFRCAINSRPDIQEVEGKSKTSGNDAFRVYRFLAPVEKHKPQRKVTRYKYQEAEVSSDEDSMIDHMDMDDSSLEAARTLANLASAGFNYSAAMPPADRSDYPEVKEEVMDDTNDSDFTNEKSVDSDESVIQQQFTADDGVNWEVVEVKHESNMEWQDDASMEEGSAGATTMFGASPAKEIEGTPSGDQPIHLPYLAAQLTCQREPLDAEALLQAGLIKVHPRQSPSKSASEMMPDVKEEKQDDEYEKVAVYPAGVFASNTARIVSSTISKPGVASLSGQAPTAITPNTNHASASVRPSKLAGLPVSSLPGLHLSGIRVMPVSVSSGCSSAPNQPMLISGRLAPGNTSQSGQLVFPVVQTSAASKTVQSSAAVTVLATAGISTNVKVFSGFTSSSTAPSIVPNASTVRHCGSRPTIAQLLSMQPEAAHSSYIASGSNLSPRLLSVSQGNAAMVARANADWTSDSFVVKPVSSSVDASLLKHISTRNAQQVSHTPVSSSQSHTTSATKFYPARTSIVSSVVNSHVSSVSMMNLPTIMSPSVTTTSLPLFTNKVLSDAAQSSRNVNQSLISVTATSSVTPSTSVSKHDVICYPTGNSLVDDKIKALLEKRQKSGLVISVADTKKPTNSEYIPSARMSTSSMSSHNGRPDLVKTVISGHPVMTARIMSTQNVPNTSTNGVRLPPEASLRTPVSRPAITVLARTPNGAQLMRIPSPIITKPAALSTPLRPPKYALTTHTDVSPALSDVKPDTQIGSSSAYKGVKTGPFSTPRYLRCPAGQRAATVTSSYPAPIATSKRFISASRYANIKSHLSSASSKSKDDGLSGLGAKIVSLASSSLGSKLIAEQRLLNVNSPLTDKPGTSDATGKSKSVVVDSEWQKAVLDAWNKGRTSDSEWQRAILDAWNKGRTVSEVEVKPPSHTTPPVLIESVDLITKSHHSSTQPARSLVQSAPSKDSSVTSTSTTTSTSNARSKKTPSCSTLPSDPAPPKQPEIPVGFKSWVWHHMTLNNDGTAKCKICAEDVYRSHGSTGTMARHLNENHDIHKDDPVDVVHNLTADHYALPRKHAAPKPPPPPPPPKLRFKSWVWHHMTLNADGTAKCKICSEDVHRRSSSTGMMMAHLNEVHGIYKEDSAQAPENSSNTSATSLDSKQLQSDDPTSDSDPEVDICDDDEDSPTTYTTELPSVLTAEQLESSKKYYAPPRTTVRDLLKARMLRKSEKRRSAHGTVTIDDLEVAETHAKLEAARADLPAALAAAAAGGVKTALKRKLSDGKIIVRDSSAKIFTSDDAQGANSAKNRENFRRSAQGADSTKKMKNDRLESSTGVKCKKLRLDSETQVGVKVAAVSTPDSGGDKCKPTSQPPTEIQTVFVRPDMSCTVLSGQDWSYTEVKPDGTRVVHNTQIPGQLPPGTNEIYIEAEVQFGGTSSDSQLRTTASVIDDVDIKSDVPQGVSSDATAHSCQENQEFKEEPISLDSSQLPHATSLKTEEEMGEPVPASVKEEMAASTQLCLRHDAKSGADVDEKLEEILACASVSPQTTLPPGLQLVQLQSGVFVLCSEDALKVATSCDEVTSGSDQEGNSSATNTAGDEKEGQSNTGEEDSDSSTAPRKMVVTTDANDGICTSEYSDSSADSDDDGEPLHNVRSVSKTVLPETAADKTDGISSYIKQSNAGENSDSTGDERAAFMQKLIGYFHTSEEETLKLCQTEKKEASDISCTEFDCTKKEGKVVMQERVCGSPSDHMVGGAASHAGEVEGTKDTDHREHIYISDKKDRVPVECVFIPEDEHSTETKRYPADTGSDWGNVRARTRLIKVEREKSSDNAENNIAVISVKSEPEEVIGSISLVDNLKLEKPDASALVEKITDICRRESESAAEENASACENDVRIEDAGADNLCGEVTSDSSEAVLEHVRTCPQHLVGKCMHASRESLHLKGTISKRLREEYRTACNKILAARISMEVSRQYIEADYIQKIETQVNHAIDDAFLEIENTRRTLLDVISAVKSATQSSLEFNTASKTKITHIIEMAVSNAIDHAIKVHFGPLKTQFCKHLAILELELDCIRRWAAGKGYSTDEFFRDAPLTDLDGSDVASEVMKVLPRSESEMEREMMESGIIVASDVEMVNDEDVKAPDTDDGLHIPAAYQENLGDHSPANSAMAVESSSDNQEMLDNSDHKPSLDLSAVNGENKSCGWTTKLDQCTDSKDTSPSGSTVISADQSASEGDTVMGVVSVGQDRAEHCHAQVYSHLLRPQTVVSVDMSGPGHDTMETVVPVSERKPESTSAEIGEFRVLTTSSTTLVVEDVVKMRNSPISTSVMTVASLDLDKLERDSAQTVASSDQDNRSDSCNLGTGNVCQSNDAGLSPEAGVKCSTETESAAKTTNVYCLNRSEPEDLVKDEMEATVADAVLTSDEQRGEILDMDGINESEQESLSDKGSVTKTLMSVGNVQVPLFDESEMTECVPVSLTNDSAVDDAFMSNLNVNDVNSCMHDSVQAGVNTDSNQGGAASDVHVDMKSDHSYITSDPPDMNICGDETTHAHTSDSPNICGDETTHAHTSDSPNICGDETTHARTSDSPNICGDEKTQAHTSDSPNICRDETTHASTSDSPNICGDETTHARTSDSPNICCDETTHASTSDSPNICRDETTQARTSDSPNICGDETTHAHTSDSPNICRDETTHAHSTYACIPAQDGFTTSGSLQMSSRQDKMTNIKVHSEPQELLDSESLDGDTSSITEKTDASSDGDTCIVMETGDASHSNCDITEMHQVDAGIESPPEQLFQS